MLVYAHRAARGLAPENTLYACQKAVQYPIDFIDFDTVLTKDGKWVVIHDLKLNPAIVRNKKGEFITDALPIYSLGYEELLDFNVGLIDPNSKYASYFPMQEKRPFEKIPLLKEVIDYVQLIAKGVGFQIEIKRDPKQPHLSATAEKCAEALYSELESANIVGSVEIQSFDFEVLLHLQKINPQIKTTFLSKVSDPTLPKKIKELGGFCWGPFQMELNQQSVLEARSYGLKVVPWGYPEKEGCEFNAPQIQKLIEWEVDGIITDRPDLLLAILKR